MKGKLWQAIFLQIGTIIGAGIFGLPYAFSLAGFPLGASYLIFLTILCLIVNLAYAEVILRTPGDHQLTGYGRLYLGKTGSALATLALMASSYGALLAYTTQMGSFATLLLSVTENSFIFSVIIFILASLTAILGLKRISQLETLIVPGIITVMTWILILGLDRFQLRQIPLSPPNWSTAAAPLGIILFAISGTSVIPEIEEILRNRHHQLKKALIWGTLIPALIYFFFAIIIAGISGESTSGDAISGLTPFLPAIVVKAGALLGLLTMFSSFLTLGYVLKEMFFRDFKFNSVFAWFLSLSPPLILFLLGARSFIQILEISGGVMGGLTGLLIMNLYLKARTKTTATPYLSLTLPAKIVWVICLFFFSITVQELFTIIQKLIK